MKKFFSMFLSIVMLLSVASGLSLTASAQTSGEFTYEVLNNPKYIWITGYTGSASKVVVPKEIDGYGVVGIGESAFAKNESIVEVVLPDTVESIQNYAFFFCKNLKSITFTSALTEIRFYAFQGCYSLKDVYYNGTKEQWDKISIINGEDEGNIEIVSATVHFVTGGSWIKSNNRWWYKHTDGYYTKNDWEKIDGKWYYFEKSGWMLTGWQKVDGSWYYMNSAGAMLTGWQKIDGSWYYMNSAGRMQTGWQKIGGSWYYMNSAGRMQTGWQKIGGAWYYMNSAGRMQHDRWVGNYYVNASGKWVKSR